MIGFMAVMVPLVSCSTVLEEQLVGGLFVCLAVAVGLTPRCADDRDREPLEGRNQDV
jgi:hypothetical protein